MRISTITAVCGAVALSGCLNVAEITGPSAAEMQTITSSCQHQLGLSADVTASESAKLSDCISRSLIAAGYAKPAPVLSAFEQRALTAQENARAMNAFCPRGAAVLYSGSTYCVGIK